MFLTPQSPLLKERGRWEDKKQKNMKTIKLLFAFCLAKLISSPIGGGREGALLAQQDPMVSQYMFNGLYLSPAYAGVRKAPNVTGTFRKQWAALDGSPVTQSLSYDQKLSSTMGAGLIIVNDKIGVTGQTDFSGDYSYHLKLAEEMNLSFGLRAGVSNYRARITKLTVWDEGDESFSQDIKGKWIPNFGTGAYLHGQKYFAGISLPRMLNYDPATFLHIELDRAPLYQRHFYLTGGYEFTFKEKYTLKPSMLFKYVHAAPAQVDLNVMGYYKSMFGAGLSFRTKNAIVGLLEFNSQKKYRIGYSFDYSFSALSKYSSGSHEIMVSYDLDKGIGNPSFTE